MHAHLGHSSRSSQEEATARAGAPEKKLAEPSQQDFVPAACAVKLRVLQTYEREPLKTELQPVPDVAHQTGCLKAASALSSPQLCTKQNDLRRLQR